MTTTTNAPTSATNGESGAISQPIVRFDFGLIAAFLLPLFALIPLLSNPGLPNGSDVLYHTYRAAEMNRAWEIGLLQPTWADGLYYGYGSPLWHFYASLTYHLSSALMQVAGISALTALRTLIVAALIVASVSTYLFTRAYAGRLAGVIAALIYVYSPYLLYTEPYARGAYPELLAFALLPLIFWRFDRLLQTGRGLDALLAALSLYVLIITHNLMAVTITVLLALWLLWRMLPYVRAGRDALRPFGVAFLAGLIGIGLGAHFWLPVVLESPTVNLDNLTGVSLLNYENFFVPLGDLLALPPIADDGEINALRNVLTLGVAQWVLALVGFVTVTVLTIRARQGTLVFWQALFFGVMALVLIVLITPASAPLWSSLRPLQFLQFPWRLLGPVAFALAVLAGMNALWLRRLPPQGELLATASGVALIIVTATPLFFVPEWLHTDVDTSRSAYFQQEIAGRQRGTTFTDEFRPADVTSLADPTPSLLDDYSDGYPVDRLNRTALPATMEAELIDSGPQHNVWRFNVVQEDRVEVLTHNWAGWTAEIDGRRVDITPSPNHGFITFRVPQGQPTVRLYLGTTPARVLGWAVTALSGLGLLMLLSLFPRFVPNSRANRQLRATLNAERPERIHVLDGRQRLGLLAGAGLTALLLLGLLRPGLAYNDTPPGEAPADVQVVFTLDEQFQLLGYDINRRDFRPGETLELGLYWYALEPSQIDYSSFVHVAPNAETPPIAQQDKLHPGGRAVSEWWTPEGYIYDPYSLSLPADLAPGDYEIFVGLYTCEPIPDECGNGYRPTAVSPLGDVVGDRVPLGTITVR